MYVQVQKELAEAESVPSSPTRLALSPAAAVEPIVAARIGATLGYTVTDLLADLGMEVSKCALLYDVLFSKWYVVNGLYLATWTCSCVILRFTTGLACLLSFLAVHTSLHDTIIGNAPVSHASHSTCQARQTGRAVAKCCKKM